MPIRIRRQRTRGWRLPPNAIIVTRGTKYGNPYRVGIDGDAAECVQAYAEALNEWMQLSPQGFAEWLAPLRGHDLACWCKTSDVCHADVLLSLAAALEPPT